jgi:hypothetical protein
MTHLGLTVMRARPDRGAAPHERLGSDPVLAILTRIQPLTVSLKRTVHGR